MSFAVRPPRDRPDWKTVRDQINLTALATDLLGPPMRRQGRRLEWLCPFHDDRSPSLSIEEGKHWWRCWACGEHGDAATLLMKIDNLTFPEAVRRITGDPADWRPRPGPPVRRTGGPETPKGQGRTNPRIGPDEVADLTQQASLRLWSDDGKEALTYLRGRGLTDETIRRAGLGFIQSGNPLIPWRPPAVLFPWRDRGRVVKINARVLPDWMESQPPDRRPPKYLEVFRDGSPAIYPSPETIIPGRPVVITEGEADALIVTQEIGDKANVITLGGTSAAPDWEVMTRLSGCFPWLIALDNDPPGDKAADGWNQYTSAIRARPPGRCKDWTDAHQTGRNRIRHQLFPLLGWKSPDWSKLSTQRWGPGLDDSTTGIETDRPARTTEEIQAILDAIRDDPEYRDEREAIRLEGTKDDICEK